MSSKTRIEWVDVYKGIGIVCMVISHIGFGNGLDKFIHSWNMPMFFFISGYLFDYKRISSAEKTGTFIIRKMKGLLFPYFSCSVLYFLIWMIKYRPAHTAVFETINSILWINTNNGLPIANALWFLTSLFWSEMLFCAVHLLIKNKNICCLIIGGLSFFASVVFLFCNIELPWAGNPALVGSAFFAFGYWINTNSRWKNTVCSLNIAKNTLIFIMLTILIMVNKTVNMRTSDYQYVVLFWVNALLMCIVLLNYAKQFNKAEGGTN